MPVKDRKELLKEVSRLASLLTEEEKKEIFMEKGLPISIFGRKHSGLEAIVVYLKDFEKKTIKEIAKLLKRQTSTIYTTYQKGKKKGKLVVSDGSILVPWTIFANRRFSILETLVAHLKSKKLSLAQISKKLNRSYSTIKTVSYRYHEKE